MARERIDIIVNERGAARAGKNVSAIGRAAGLARGGVVALGTALAGLGLAVTAGEFFKLADSFTKINNQIRLVTSSSEELVAVQREVFNIAQRTRAPLEATTGLYRRLASSADALGVSQQDTFNVVETVGQTLALAGADATAASNGLRQFTQGLDAGILRAEEFNGIIENIPDLAFAIAKGLKDGSGVTIGEFRKMVIAGEVTSKDLIAALQNVAPEIAESFKNSGRTIGQSFTVLQNGVLQAVGTIDEAIGASDLFSGAIINLAENIDVLIIDGFAFMLEAIADVLTGFANLFEVVEEFAALVGVDFNFITNLFALMAAEANLAFTGIINGLNLLRVGALGIKSALELVANAFGLISDQEVLDGLDKLSNANVDLAASSLKVEDAIVETGLAAQKLKDELFSDQDTNLISRNIRGVGTDVQSLAADMRKLSEDAKAAKLDTGGFGGGGPEALPGFTPSSEVIAGLGSAEAGARSQSIFGSNTDDLTLDAVVKAIERVPDEPEVDEAAERMGGVFASGVSGAVGSALKGEAIDFSGFFTDLFTSELEAGLKEAFTSALDSMKKGLDGLFEGLGEGAGLDLGGLGAGIGLIGSVAAAGFASTESSVKRGSAKSAVDAVAPTRGAIVGPSNVPIFQVADSISDAMKPLFNETVEQGTTLKQILAAVRGGGGVGDASAALDAFLRQELNSSTSLG